MRPAARDVMSYRLNWHSRQSRAIVALIIVLCSVGLLSKTTWREQVYRIMPENPLQTPHSRLGPENGTLGFGAIYVLTTNPDTWRVQGLRKAASLVGLQLTVPHQKPLSDDDVLEFLNSDPSKRPEHLNSTRALLGHISILEEFIKSDLQSALICEDDVDFSIHIKSQMSYLSEAVWRKRDSDEKNPAPNSSAQTLTRLHHPFGLPSWDILWLGHMGAEYAGTEVTNYEDPHALPWTRLTSTYNNYYSSMADSVAPQPQQFWSGVAPLATYAYALSRAHAIEIVSKLREEKTSDPYDVWLHVKCKGDWQTCAAPVPELMHHQRVPGQLALSNIDDDDDGGAKGEAKAGKQDLDWWKRRHKYTYNVEWSARCNAAGSGERIGDGWQCLPGRDDHKT